MRNFKIDFVVTWVDGSDDEWKKVYDAYSNEIICKDMNGIERFRSSKRLLNLWLYGVKKYAKWVNNIYVVVDRISGRDLSFSDNNIKLVYHDQFIPRKFLPTFNSNVIECFLDKIDGLSEKFVLFNDDCFIVNEVRETDFFDNRGQPVDCDYLNPIKLGTPYSKILVNNLNLLNKHCSFTYFKKWYIKRHVFKIWNPKYIKSMLIICLFEGFSGWVDEHIPIAYTKSQYTRVYDKLPDVRQNQGSRRFRTDCDISHLLVRFWRLSEGDYKQRYVGDFGKYIELTNDLNFEKLSWISRNKKILCINDTGAFDEGKLSAMNHLEKIIINLYGVAYV